MFAYWLSLKGKKLNSSESHPAKFFSTFETVVSPCDSEP